MRKPREFMFTAQVCKLWDTTVRELWRKLDLFLEKFWRMQYDATFYEIEEKEKEDRLS